MRPLREITNLINRDYWQSAVFIARTSLREQYRNSYLGIVWALVNSFVYILTLSVVFSILMHSSVKDYALFMISGLLPWQFFVAAVTRGAGALANRRHILHHTPLPKTMFVLADVMAQLYTFLISMGVAVCFAFLLDGFHLVALLLVPALLPLIITALALAVMFAYVSAYLWDIPHVLNILFQTLIWTAPLVYPLSAIPENMQQYFVYNPIYILIHPIQQILYEGIVPPLYFWMDAWLVTGISLVVSYVVYVRLRKNVIYYL